MRARSASRRRGHSATRFAVAAAWWRPTASTNGDARDEPATPFSSVCTRSGRWRWPGRGGGGGRGGAPPEAPPLLTGLVITCPSGGRLARIHDRMPAILDPDAAARWLDPERDDPGALLVPDPDDALEIYP